MKLLKGMVSLCYFNGISFERELLTPEIHKLTNQFNGGLSSVSIEGRHVQVIDEEHLLP